MHDSVVAVVGIAFAHNFAVEAVDIAVDVARGSDKVVAAGGAALLRLRLIAPCTPIHLLVLRMGLDRTIRIDPELAQSRRSFGCGHGFHV